jgi:site-specific recombinase XerD
LLRCHTSSLLLRVSLSHIRRHDLRHAYATLLLTRGVHLKSFRELLDHRTISIALDTYSHILLDMKDHLTRILEDALSWRVAL